MLDSGTIWGLAGTSVSTLMLIWAMYKQFIPAHFRAYLEVYFHKMIGWVSPYVHIKITEYRDESLTRSDAYDAIRNYLAADSAARARRLKANESKKSKSLVLSMDDHQEIEDEFKGVKVTWYTNVKVTQTQSNWGRNVSQETKYFTLSFHRRHRKMMTETYLDYVVKEGKEIGLKNRERKLYTNNSSQDWYPWRDGKWSNVPFNHPATFKTLAMDPMKKEEIMNGLIKFSKGEEYYKKVGKSWKRGYLLYGPPGTGKSTMISAIANFLDYDVYDLELTTVKDNSELKRLLLATTGKAIIVIEDIDCSLNLTGQRKTKKEEDEEEDKKKDEKKLKEEKDEKQSKVTLSGLLNSIDGLWSACSGEKIIIFTTNFVDKLDPALIRRGRMDEHIEMSYCKFEAFKVLAKNYLEVESHESFEEIERLLKETDISPADVAENLMPKSENEDVDVSFERLVKALEGEKEKAKKLAEEEEKKKQEKEETKKKEEEEEKKKKEEKEKEKEKMKEKSVEDEAKQNGDVSEENGKI